MGSSLTEVICIRRSALPSLCDKGQCAGAQKHCRHMLVPSSLTEGSLTEGCHGVQAQPVLGFHSPSHPKYEVPQEDQNALYSVSLTQSAVLGFSYSDSVLGLVQPVQPSWAQAGALPGSPAAHTLASMHWLAACGARHSGCQPFDGWSRLTWHIQTKPPTPLCWTLSPKPLTATCCLACAAPVGHWLVQIKHPQIGLSQV